MTTPAPDVSTEQPRPVPACGQLCADSCDGIEPAMEHAHSARHPKAGERSVGAVMYRARHPAADADLLDSIDAHPANWCSICQRTLLTCRLAGCSHSRSQTTAFEYVAIEYALAWAQSGRSRWDDALEDYARKVAGDKADKVLDWPTSNPANWDPPTFFFSSIVTWIAHWTHMEVGTKVGDYIGSRSSSDFPENTAGRADVESTAAAATAKHVLSRSWTRLSPHMNAAVAGLSRRGKGPNACAPEAILDGYRAQYAAWTFHENELYSPEKASDRQLGTGLGISNSTVSRFRREDLMPALEALRADRLPPHQHHALTTLVTRRDLTPDQHAALTVLTHEPDNLTITHYDALSTLHDSPGLTDTQYAALDYLNVLRNQPLTTSEAAALDTFIDYIDCRTERTNPPAPDTPSHTQEGDQR